MTSKPVAMLLADLGVTKSHSRPHVPDDNPYSETQFKTLKHLKHHPTFPERFGCIQDARGFLQGLFGWYDFDNFEHYHSGIALLTPADVHHGRAQQVITARAQVLDGDGERTFAGLELALREGLVDKIGFTGSSAVGARIGELAGRHLQAPCLELGGKNPMVVTPSADLDLAVEGALFSGFGTAGQRCTSLGTVIVHESVHDDFVARFSTATAAARIGDPTGDVLYGPLLDRRFADRFEGYLEWVGDHHKTLGSSGLGRITAANPRPGFVGDPEAGLYYHPVVVDGVRPDTGCSWRRPSGRSSA
jgi:hypothetical protein